MRSSLCFFLGVALFQSGCTWTSTCSRDGQGTDHCDDTVVAAEHPSATGSAALTCGEPGNETMDWAPEFAGIARCSFENDTLRLHVGSGACHHVDLSVPGFSGPGTYSISPDAADGLTIAMFRDVGCQTPGSATTGRAEACGTESSSCQVVIGGDFSLASGGDIDVTLDCQRLLYVGTNIACGVCTPKHPIQLSFRDCWGD